MSGVRMGVGGTQWSQMLELERRGKEKKQERQNLKIVQPDDSLWQGKHLPTPESLATHGGCPLPHKLNAVIEGGDIPGVLKHTGLHLKPIGRALSLWQRECCHLTDVTICVRVNIRVPPIHDCNLLEVQSCELNTKSDAGFQRPLLDGGKPILLVTDSTMENVKFSSESQLRHLGDSSQERCLGLAAELEMSW